MKQAVVNRYVDDLAYTLGVERDALNVVAAAKGLVAGSFTTTRNDASIVDYSSAPEGILIPNPKEIQDITLDNVRWILVIEKEAKGYPDIQTRQFLHHLYTTTPELPILALVDYDPDGLGILSTYKHGSISLAHEPGLAVSSVEWLGVRSCDFLGVAAAEGEGVQEAREVGLLRLTRRDRRIAAKMLERGDGRVDGEGGWKRELRVMLMLNVKAEIQVLGNAEALGEWLDGKLVDAVRIE
ncbi:Meiotic recombination protein rec12 [Lachnellula arida]|uniref:Meiotic recombination protein rec12 n=1 Tax=Lachnellula arida TaxID=1316785 RepID=A0A8T9B5B4_9HELO|nr:Meiotic recombination protein rec12 [Lachnellula arida]